MRIELKDVRKEYGGVPALGGVTLDVGSGERVALVGPNGSGKSTLMRAVSGFVSVEGEIRLDGTDPFHNRAGLGWRMAYVPQAMPRMGATVGELTRAVARLRRVDPAEIEGVARQVELDLPALSRRPVRALSGGMQQKLAISLALAAPVSLLVLDEPTASLDRRAREGFFRIVRERAEGATVLLGSHRLDEIRRLVDRVVALEAGSVLMDAPVGGLDAREPAGGGAEDELPRPWAFRICGGLDG